MENIIAEHVNEAAGELVQQKNIDCGAEVCTSTSTSDKFAKSMWTSHQLLS